MTYHLRKINGDSIGEILGNFISYYGVPDNLMFDRLFMQTCSKAGSNQLFCKYGIDQRHSAPRLPNKNTAENTIREVKKQFYIMITNKQTPKRL